MTGGVALKVTSWRATPPLHRHRGPVARDRPNKGTQRMHVTLGRKSRLITLGVGLITAGALATTFDVTVT